MQTHGFKFPNIVGVSVDEVIGALTFNTHGELMDIESFRLALKEYLPTGVGVRIAHATADATDTPQLAHG